MLKLGSLFSGAGGLDMAVGSVFGAETVWHCELDSAASKVLAHRWPVVPNLGSITEVDWSQVEPVDVLCGGFPCQDVSSAGKRAGLQTGTRSGLWAMYAEAIEALRPTYVVIENVRGLLSATAHRPMEPSADALGDRDSQPVLRAIGAVLGDLSDLGYDARWQTVAASAVGAPHRRERVFIAANPNGGRLEVSAQRDGQSQRSQLAAPLGRDADRRGDDTAASNADDLERPLGRSDAELGSQRRMAAVELLPTPRTSDTNGAGLHGNGGPDLRTTVAMLCTPSAADGGGGHLSRSGARSDEPLLPGQAREMDGQQWGKYAPAIARWEAVTRPAPSPTEPNKNGNPRLSAAFSEWLMGWPAGWVTDVPGISRNDQLRIVGNGVVPQCAAAALRYLLSLEVAA